MLQGLRTFNTQIKAGKTSENLLNGNGGIIWSLLKAKEITTKVKNNIMKSMKALKAMKASSINFMSYIYEF